MMKRLQSADPKGFTLVELHEILDHMMRNPKMRGEKVRVITKPEFNADGCAVVKIAVDDPTFEAAVK